MKPQIITMETGGIHNSSSISAGRIMESGTWKKQRIIVLIPSSNLLPAKVALSLWNLMFPPNQGIYKMLCLGMEVGQAYTAAIEQILAHPDLSQWEYILTIEHDNMPPADGLMKLLNRMESHPEYACIGGLYWTKGEGGVPQIWGDPTDPVVNYRPQPPKDGQLVECCGTGMGFNLFRLEMFKDEKLRKPWFKTTSSSEEGCQTQDLYFWSDARKHGYRCAIDCAIKVGHYDSNNDIIW